jgi:hypothetical protein
LTKTKQGRQILIACLLVIIGLACMMTSQAIAQTTTGSIFGTIADSTGGLIPNATVTVKNVATGITQTATSNGSGNYVFPSVAPGDYTVTTQITGFGTTTQTGIHISANQNVNTSFTLNPGATEQTVTVTAASALVDTRESQLSETVSQKRIQNLPLNGRDPYSLVQLVPGITAYSGQAAIGSQYGTSFSVNGNRSNDNTTYLDGAYDSTLFTGGGNKLPNPDALQEFRILTSNFDAEYGRYPGAVVNAIVSSGANSFHGGIHEYFRNSALNAKSYFNPVVTPLKQNQFGATIGGPIIRNKAFFFLSYEGLRINTPVILNGSAISTLTPAEARGDFSADPVAKQPKVSCNGVAGVICPNLLDPVAQNVINGYLPLEDPTTRITANQTASANSVANEGLARLDYQLHSHQISGTFYYTRGLSASPTAGGNQILNYAGGSNYSSVTILL